MSAPRWIHDFYNSEPGSAALSRSGGTGDTAAGGV